MDKSYLKKQISIGVILIIVGISFFMKDFVADKREQVFTAMNLELTELLAYDESEIDESDDSLEKADVNDENTNEEQEENINEEVKPSQEVIVNYETYIGFLEIPKISFSRGFYSKDSSLNNVKFNLKILAQSSYPDEENGNVIIIGHSGNYNNSYFANLYQLDLEDTAMVKYNGVTYTYKVVNIYTDTKDGTVTIYRDQTKKCLTLITCTKDDDTTQTIYIFELVKAE